ncbi:hypothetical protein ACS0TY_020860 [Phlomoides rotata]
MVVEMAAQGEQGGSAEVIYSGQAKINISHFYDYLQDTAAAAKAIAWSPQNGLLASGGGTADRCIRFWNTTSSNQLNSTDTGSQVCNLAWSKNVNEVISTHGYSHNQIMVWKYPTMSKVATLTGHSLWVLYLAMSPDGQTIVTGAGDKMLRFFCLSICKNAGTILLHQKRENHQKRVLKDHHHHHLPHCVKSAQKEKTRTTCFLFTAFITSAGTAFPSTCPS